MLRTEFSFQCWKNFANELLNFDQVTSWICRLPFWNTVYDENKWYRYKMRRYGSDSSIEHNVSLSFHLDTNSSLSGKDLLCLLLGSNSYDAVGASHSHEGATAAVHTERGRRVAQVKTTTADTRRHRRRRRSYRRCCRRRFRFLGRGSLTHITAIICRRRRCSRLPSIDLRCLSLPINNCY